MDKKIRFIFIIFLIAFLFVGCSAGSSDKEKVLDILEEKDYVESGLKHIGDSKVYTSSFDATPIYSYCDVYEKNDKLYAINFNKLIIHHDNEVGCDYIVTIYDDVEFKKNQTVEEYNEEKQEYEEVVKDIYETNRYSYKKYCVNIEENTVRDF